MWKNEICSLYLQVKSLQVKRKKKKRMTPKNSELEI